MKDNYEITRYEQAAELLPVRWRDAACHLTRQQKAQAEEFRLRAGFPVSVLLPEGELRLQPEGGAAEVRQAELEQLCDRVTGYSRYAAGEAIGSGFITAPNGFRIGLCGTAVVREGCCINLRDISSVAVRIGRARPGLALELLPRLTEAGQLCSTLILSPPGLGKTTLLRDLIRTVSNGTAELPPHRTAVVDERGELAVMYRGKAQMDLGSHSDVLDACPKAVAIPMLLRSMNPQVIALDEITAPADLRAAEEAANCGVILLATIHAANRQELAEKPLFRRLESMAVFRRFVTITAAGGQRHYEVSAL